MALNIHVVLPEEGPAKYYTRHTAYLLWRGDICLGRLEDYPEYVEAMDDQLQAEGLSVSRSWVLKPC